LKKLKIPLKFISNSSLNHIHINFLTIINCVIITIFTMSRNNGKFPDRVSQMENQKTVIEKKKLEIIEKQRNKLIVKAIHENMKTNKADKSEIDESVQDNNTASIFSNDGSFLENFKKMEKMAKKNLQIEIPVEIGSVSLVANDASVLNHVEQTNMMDKVRYKLILKFKRISTS
jgi:hypothetical protein